MARREHLSDEELALLKAQTAATLARPGQDAAELAQKAAIAQQQLNLNRLINEQRVGLGREEIGSKEKLGNLGAALDALKLDQTGRSVGETAHVNALGDLAHRADIPANVLADTYKSEGYPGLANALDVQHQRERESAIQAVIPALQGAKSDAAREKGIAPALSKFPGAYQEALARAFPKPGAEVTPRPEPTVAPTVRSTTDTGVATSPLASTLLRLAGVGPQATTEPTGTITRTLPGINAAPNALSDPSVGALAGSTVTPTADDLTRLALPSGGVAIVKSKAGTDGIGDYVARENAKYNPVAVETQPQYGDVAPIPFGAFHGGIQPVVPSQLIAAQPVTSPVPVANPTPGVTATPVPVAATTPAPNAPELAAMLELIRQKKLQNQ